MVIFVWATVVFFDIVRPPDQTLEIYSTGKRWMWRSSTSTARARSTSCTCPMGRPVKVTFTSEDVLHTLYIPAFRVKADAIPGPLQLDLVHATKTGEFHLFCAEYCGTKHSGMIGTVVVMEPDDYQAWLSGGGGAAAGRARRAAVPAAGVHHLPPRPTAPAAGRRWPACSARRCSWRTARRSSPTTRYIRESILTPQLKLVAGYQPLMPTFQGLVNEEGVMSLIEYMKSLPAASRPAAPRRRRSAAPPRHRAGRVRSGP